MVYKQQVLVYSSSVWKGITPSLFSLTFRHGSHSRRKQSEPVSLAVRTPALGVVPAFNLYSLSSSGKLLRLCIFSFQLNLTVTLSLQCPLHVNPSNSNLSGRQCYFTGKFILNRCFKKATLHSWDMLNGLIFFFSFLLLIVRSLFTFCKLVVLFWFSPWLLKLSRPLKHYIRRGSWHLGNVGCMTWVLCNHGFTSWF